ncbi:MAG: hypothetical protein WCJ37_13110 [Syntrophus sp. (in: bacteria)]
MWLFDIIKNGMLVDNQCYQVNQGVLTNRKLSDSIQLNQKSQGQWSNAQNNETAIWHFLNSVSHDLENKLSKNSADALVLFNDEDYENNVDGGFVSVTGTDARNFILNTGNLIGYVKRGDYALKISSRFGNSFLQYIIADADGFLEIENIGGESHVDGYGWLLAYLWNIKFKLAYRLGLPKTYTTKTERVSRVRGSIDPIDFFQNKTSGKYLCSYRQQSYDSPATSLFINAYENVEHYTFCHKSRNIYNSFVTANQGVKRTNQEILKTPYFTNPFYHDYNVLIDLSKQVVTHQGADFGSNDDSSAFFFDVSMLFEYFIRKMLKRDGIRLLSKFEQRYKIPTGSLGKYVRKLEPDIVFESNGGLYVFDVKYKAFDPIYGVKREDLFQLHTYIGQYANADSIKGCGFIYPISEDKWKSFSLDRSSGIISDFIRQQRNEIPFHVLFLMVPDDSNSDYYRLMRESCECFLEQINRMHNKALHRTSITLRSIAVVEH